VRRFAHSGQPSACRKPGPCDSATAETFRAELCTTPFPAFDGSPSAQGRWAASPVSRQWVDRLAAEPHGRTVSTVGRTSGTETEARRSPGRPGGGVQPPLRLAGQVPDQGGIVVPYPKVRDPVLACDLQAGQQGGILYVGGRFDGAKEDRAGFNDLQVGAAEHDSAPCNRSFRSARSPPRLSRDKDRGVGFEVKQIPGRWKWAVPRLECASERGSLHEHDRACPLQVLLSVVNLLLVLHCEANNDYDYPARVLGEIPAHLANHPIEFSLLLR